MAERLVGDPARAPSLPARAVGAGTGAGEPAGLTGAWARQRSAPLPVVRSAGREPTVDLVAVEEPLEIRLAGETVAVIMRTPGEDHLLALGYLFAEGLLSRAEDAAAVFHCGRLGEEGYGNVVEVSPASGAAIAWERLDASRRGGVTSSACGVCGRATLEDLLVGLPPLPPGQAVAAAAVAAAMEGLRRHQPTFEATGGTHAAALWDAEGGLVAAHEDVGRHNAVDKVVGALLLARAGGARPTPAVLVMSGRGGFEIVHKAARAGVPVVACVSAPTTLAVAVAQAAGVTLCGFVRGGRMNVYAHPARLTGLGATPA